MNPSTTITPDLNPSLYEKKQGWDVLKSGAQTTPTTITSNDLSKVIPIQLPTQQPPTDVGNIVVSNNYGVATGLNGYSIDDKGQFVAQPPKVDTSKPADTGTVGRMDNLRALLGLAPKQADVLSSPEVTAKNAIVEQRQQEVNTAVSQLNAITARQQQAQIMLDKRLAEETGLTKEQKKLKKDTEMAKINYDAAIEALPVQATVSAAQGNLALAQQSLDSLTKMKTEKVKNDYDYQKSLYDAISGFVTKEEKITLDKLNKENDREYETKKANIKAIDDWSRLALENQQSSLIRTIQAVDPSSPTFNEELGRIVSQIKQSPQTQLFKLDNGDIVAVDKKGNIVNRSQTATTSTVPDEYKSVVNSVSTLVPAASRAAFTNALSTSLSSGDWKNAYSTIATATEEMLKGTTKTNFSDVRNDIEIMNGMRSAIQAYVDAGGNLGYLKGSADKIAKNFGQLATDPKFASLATQLEREFQNYRLNMTGAAFSPQESKEYASVNPRGNASLDLNLTTIDGALKQLINRYTGTINARVPGADKIYQKLSTEAASTANTGQRMSLDDAYAEYQKVTGTGQQWNK